MQIGLRFIKRLFPIISLIAIAWVLYRLWCFNDWNRFWTHLNNHTKEAVLLFGIQLILLFINLSLESKKWQLLAAPVARISFDKSFSQVLKGIQFGMITPARAGEPLGKSVFYKSTERGKIVILSFAGSLIQNGVIFMAALLAFLTIGSNYHPLEKKITSYYSLFDSSLILTIGITSIILLVVLVRKSPWCHQRLLNLKKHLHLFTQYKAKDLLKITCLTICRYLVFTFQYYLLLNFFGLINIQYGLLAIFIYYGALSFFPSAGAGDLGIRASLALLVFGHSALTGPAIVMASLLLWIINLGIPAFLPSLFRIPSYLKSQVQEKTLPT